jgi:hypothetical protein
MNTPWHGLFGGIITTFPVYYFLLWLNLISTPILICLSVLFTLSFVLGMLPDLAGWIGRGSYNSNTAYHDAHNFKGIFKYFKYIPPYTLHVIMDKPVHDEEYNWKLSAHIIEIAGWLVMLPFMYWWLFLI